MNIIRVGIPAIQPQITGTDAKGGGKSGSIRANGGKLRHSAYLIDQVAVLYANNGFVEFFEGAGLHTIEAQGTPPMLASAFSSMWSACQRMSLCAHRNRQQKGSSPLQRNGLTLRRRLRHENTTGERRRSIAGTPLKAQRKHDETFEQLMRAIANRTRTKLHGETVRTDAQKQIAYTTNHRAFPFSALLLSRSIHVPDTRKR